MDFFNTKSIWADMAALHFSMPEKGRAICAVNADAGRIRENNNLS